MTQASWLVLAFKVVEIASVVTITAFVGYYTKLAPWYKNPIGRTIVLKDLALILVLIPSILSLFFHFSRVTSYVAAWFDMISFAMVPVIMVWRIAVFRKIHKADDHENTENTAHSPLYCSVDASAPAVLTTPPGRSTW